MYEDEPSDKVHDVLASAVFGDHALGRPVIGSADVVSSVPVPAIAEYHDARYALLNLVVAAAGNVDHREVVQLVEAACERAVPSGARAVNGRVTPATAGPTLRFHRKDTEQYHLCAGAPGLTRADERRFSLRVLDTILGGSTSSRLFQEVREKRGLAYSVYSYASPYVDSGQVAIYVGTRPENVGQAMDVIGGELRRLQREPIAKEELERAKENVKGRFVLALESTLARMNRIGGALLTDVPLLTLDETLLAIDGVTLDGVTELARELFDPERMSVAGVGADEEAFRSAAALLNPALASVAAA